MYIPKNMLMQGDDAIASFISEFGFGSLISPDLEVTRLPMLFEADYAEKGRIVGHMARANPQWRGLTGQRVSVLFDGPHAYVAAKWYETTPAVPTWNYASVQCFGRFVELNEADTLEAMNNLIRKYEPELLLDRARMPAEYVDKLRKAVVGFSIIVDDIHAKEKLGQHKKAGDQQQVFNALSNSAMTEAQQLAGYMKKRQLGTGIEH
ncbi:FMN-binding negative transcriptional regulator [Alteromonas facilis]|uniref:FMN-binding negative transcriptional regulator n=1 Tax=Alteromonas facilis TaxID=2048004 RepID=UPI000C295313|nr:FMN-binding negative transcriptional regulator [Alteromonas facilis]